MPSRLGSLLLVDEGGVPLRTTIGAWNPAEVTRIGAELARVVAAIHERGVIHGDINPGNILLAPPDGRPWLIDFDRATTVDGVLVSPPPEPGTMQAYLAPEQTGRTGRPVDQRADLYALGATLYHLATGKAPDAKQLLAQARKARPVDRRAAADAEFPCSSRGPSRLLLSPD